MHGIIRGDEQCIIDTLHLGTDLQLFLTSVILAG